MTALLCAALIYCGIRAASLHQALRETEVLLWTELDAALDGAVRMLALAQAAPSAPAPLLAAYEYSLTLDRLGAAAARLFERRGVRTETFYGYLLSLSGGIRSLCEEVRRHGAADPLWAGEIRRRLSGIRAALVPERLGALSRDELQQLLDALPTAAPAEPSLSARTAPQDTPACGVPLP